MDIMRPFIDVHDLQIHHVTHHRVVVRDAITAQHISRRAGNIERLTTRVSLDEADEVGLDSACGE